MNLIYLDLAPAYIPFLVQATKGDGSKIDPTVDTLIIYEEGGADATFDSTTITGSPFDPAKVNTKTGLWGAMVAKSALTAGKWYVALWEMTVDGITTAKVEKYFACNSVQDVDKFSSESGQAQGGAVGNITLRAAASATNDLFLGQKISIYSGTGAGQTRGISNYNGNTKVATVARNWAVAPDATSMYRVEHDFGPKVNNALAVTAGTVDDKTGYSLSATDFINKWINNKLIESPAGTWKLYDDDGTTVLKTWTWNTETTTRSAAV